MISAYVGINFIELLLEGIEVLKEKVQCALRDNYVIIYG